MWHTLGRPPPAAPRAPVLTVFVLRAQLRDGLAHAAVAVALLAQRARLTQLPLHLLQRHAQPRALRVDRADLLLSPVQLRLGLLRWLGQGGAGQGRVRSSARPACAGCASGASTAAAQRSAAQAGPHLQAPLLLGHGGDHGVMPRLRLGRLLGCTHRGRTGRRAGGQGDGGRHKAGRMHMRRCQQLSRQRQTH